MEMSTKKMIHKEVYCGSELEKIQKNNIESINSGYRNLDLELPHGSWPKSCLIEILSREESVSEIILLLPTLKKIVVCRNSLCTFTMCVCNEHENMHLEKKYVVP